MWTVSKFLCCIPLKYGLVIIGIFYLTEGFIFCITVHNSDVQKGYLDGLGFYEGLLVRFARFGKFEVAKPALMVALILKIVFAGLDIWIGIFILLFEPWSQILSLVLILLSLVLEWTQKTVLMSVINSHSSLTSERWGWKVMGIIILSLVTATMIHTYIWVCVYSYLQEVKEGSSSEEKKRLKRTEYHSYRI